MANDLEGKVFLLTGATEGIGKAAAFDFAKRGATLVLVARNPDKGARVVADVKAASGNEHVGLLVGDLSKLADTRSVASAFRDKHDRLDVLANNAGAVFTTHQLSADGFEMTFALNHLSYFLLTHELLDVLLKTPGARVISTSSGAHAGGKIDLDDIARRPSKKAGWFAYCDSKLANVLFTRELARRTADRGLVVNCFHPGFVRTGFAQNNEGLIRTLVRLGGAMFARTPEKGAETLVWLATSPEGARTSGEYFHDLRVRKTARLGNDGDLAKRLWAYSEQLCGIAEMREASGSASASLQAN